MRILFDVHLPNVRAIYGVVLVEERLLFILNNPKYPLVSRHEVVRVNRTTRLPVPNDNLFQWEVVHPFRVYRLLLV